MITIYYLEMSRADELIQSTRAADLSVIEAEIDNYRLNRFLYQLVGEPWQWVDKLKLTDGEWQRYVENPDLRTWVAYHRGSIAGYFELLKTADGSIQIAYFGLAPDFIGQGFGGYLLTQAIRQAWAIPGARRVCVNTCSLDHPGALDNYRARGFRLVSQEEKPSVGGRPRLAAGTVALKDTGQK